MGRKQKVQKVNKNQKNFAVQEDFARVAKIFAMLGIVAKLRKFRKVAKMAGIFAGVAKSCENGRNFCRGCENFATPAKMPASLLLASVASPIFALMLLF